MDVQKPFHCSRVSDNMNALQIRSCPQRYAATGGVQGAPGRSHVHARRSTLVPRATVKFVGGDGQEIAVECADVRLLRKLNTHEDEHG